MPLYTKLCDKVLVGYRMFYNPRDERWHFEHRSFCNTFKEGGTVVHHKNYNKLNNNPTNLVKITNKEHKWIHNNNTLDYRKTSKTIKQWHEKMKGTKRYEERSEKCRQSVYKYRAKLNPDYIPSSVLRRNKIDYIEKTFGVTYDNLTPAQKDSYGVKYSRAVDPTIQQRITERIKQNHKDGKYKKAYEAIHDRVWYTDGVNNVYIKQDETPPEGFSRGRTISKEVYSKRKKFSDRSVEEQTELRQKYAKASKGKRWITNGVDEMYIPAKEQLPEGYSYGRLKREYRNHKVVRVEYIHKPCRVYDLEIEDNHNFALDCGVFVHNSKDIADSLAGALFNATLHKQSLIDSMQLLDIAYEVNGELDARQEILDNMQSSMLASSGMSSASKISAGDRQSMSAKLDELLNGYGGDSNILVW